MTNDNTRRRDGEIARRLRAHYDALDPPDGLWERIEQSARVTPTAHAATKRWRSGIGLAAACAAVAVALAWLVAPTLQRGAAVEVDAHALSAEFATYIASGRAPDVRSTSGGDLQSWFGERLDRQPPAPHTASFMQLAGGRLCQIKGLRMAAYMYDLRGLPVSVYVTAPEAVRYDAGPEPRFIGAFDNYGLATWRDGAWRYSLVADLPSTQLVDVARELAARS